jgi:hypothetical protein
MCKLSWNHQLPINQMGVTNSNLLSHPAPRRKSRIAGHPNRANPNTLALLDPQIDGEGGTAVRILSVGGADGIRTHDLLDAIEARSQLRHGPTEKESMSLL